MALDTRLAPLATRAVTCDAPGGTSLTFGNRGPLFVIAGPCVAESAALCLAVARAVADTCAARGLPYVFKASYDKANRSSARAYRGPGLERGLEILAEVREAVGVPILSDVHTPGEARRAGAVLDIVQVPAFLCRQTDLLIAAGETGKVVNVKKGQFVAPKDMRLAVEKVRATGNQRVLLTERGATFGYHNLVVDLRGIPTMQAAAETPVVFDAGHSVQQPGGLGDASGGDRTMIPVLARAAVAAGCDGLFLETHPDPEHAKSDGPNSWPLDDIDSLLAQLATLAACVRSLGSDAEAVSENDLG